MRISRPEGRKPFSLTAILGILCWLIAADAHAQAIRVTAANASNGRVYDVVFAGSGGTIEVLNNDANQHVSLRSLVFVPNTQTGKIDLLVSDASCVNVKERVTIVEDGGDVPFDCKASYSGQRLLDPQP